MKIDIMAEPPSGKEIALERWKIEKGKEKTLRNFTVGCWSLIAIITLYWLWAGHNHELTLQLAALKNLWAAQVFWFLAALMVLAVSLREKCAGGKLFVAGVFLWNLAVTTATSFTAMNAVCLFWKPSIFVNACISSLGPLLSGFLSVLGTAAIEFVIDETKHRLNHFNIVSASTILYPSMMEACRINSDCARYKKEGITLRGRAMVEAEAKALIAWAADFGEKIAEEVCAEPEEVKVEELKPECSDQAAAIEMVNNFFDNDDASAA